MWQVIASHIPSPLLCSVQCRKMPWGMSGSQYDSQFPVELGALCYRREIGRLGLLDLPTSKRPVAGGLEAPSTWCVIVLEGKPGSITRVEAHKALFFSYCTELRAGVVSWRR